MARKTLKQKLKQQLRQTKQQLSVEHMQAGLAINYETQAMQSVAMAHGVMASLLLAKQHAPAEAFAEIEKVSQQRIAQCLQALVGMGFTHEEANRRILQGH